VSPRGPGFFKAIGSGDAVHIIFVPKGGIAEGMVWVQGGTLPQSSELAGTAVPTIQFAK